MLTCKITGQQSRYMTERGIYEGELNENLKYFLFIIMDGMVC